MVVDEGKQSQEQKPEEKKPEPSAREMVAEAMQIARGEKEPPKQPEEKLEGQEQKSEEKKPEQPEESKKSEDIEKAIEKIKLQYQTLLDEERRQKAGIYRDLKKTREKLQQIQTQPRSQTQPKDIEELINSATSALKEAGFTDKQISELQEKALDDPFAVATAISYVIASQKSAKEPERPEVREPEVDTDEIMAGWRKSVLEIMDKHPDLWKKNEKGELVVNEESPKFKIYDDEAKKLLLEDPSLQYSPYLPKLVALRMEQRLLEEKIAESKKEAFEEGRKAEAERQTRVEEGFVASSGVRPEAKKTIQLTPDEEAQARRDVERGLFKSIEEWAEYYKSRQFRY